MNGRSGRHYAAPNVHRRFSRPPPAACRTAPARGNPGALRGTARGTRCSPAAGTAPPGHAPRSAAGGAARPRPGPRGSSPPGTRPQRC
ncbi:hypothetical protein G6F46_015409 [Rhizopus delemar]|nr:hypothetical protein G6F46_015409 [Rhizopus delemar]